MELYFKPLYLIKAFFLLLLCSNIQAQTDSTKFKFDLDIRYRFEAWEGMNARNYGNDSPDALGKLNDRFHLLRIIPGITYTPVNNLTFAVRLQDSRAFGWSLRNSRYPELFRIKAPETQQPYYTMNPNEEFFEIHELYLELRDLPKNFKFTVGRQKINYGDNRIFGPGNWGNTGRWTWDAAKVSYKHKKHFIDVFGGGTKIHDPLQLAIPFTNTQTWGGGLYGHFYLPKALNIDYFYAIKKPGSAPYANTQNFCRQWAGTRIHNKNFHNLFIDAVFAKQFGHQKNKQISAYGFVGKVGYHIPKTYGNPLLSYRYTFASGGVDNKHRTFDPVFGARDSYYGRMNLTAWSNIKSHEVILEFFPSEKFWLELTYNIFYVPAPEDVKLLGTLELKDNENHLGNEANLFLRYDLNNRWQLIAAAGYFTPGKVKPINNSKAPSAQWYAVQTLFKF